MQISHTIATRTSCGLDVDAHYLEYHMHGCLTIGNYLPPLWNQAFIKKSGLYPHSRVMSRHRWDWNWSRHISAGPGIDVTDIHTHTLTDTTDCYNPSACALRVNDTVRRERSEWFSKLQIIFSIAGSWCMGGWSLTWHWLAGEVNNSSHQSLLQKPDGEDDWQLESIIIIIATVEPL